MLTPKKKISRKELKEDALVTTYVKVTTFYEKNRRFISIVLTVLVLLAIAAFLYFKSRASNNENASAYLGGVYSLYDAGQYQQAVDGIPERNIKGLREIVDQFGNSKAGDVARFYLASAYYNLGKYDEALENFKKCGFSDETLEISRLSGVACAAEAKGMFKDAAEYFEKAAKKDLKSVNAAENLYNAARDYAQAGDKETALDLYKKVKKEYPNSMSARDAERAMAGLAN